FLGALPEIFFLGLVLHLGPETLERAPEGLFAILEVASWPGKTVAGILGMAPGPRWAIGLVNPPTELVAHEYSLVLAANSLVYGLVGALVGRPSDRAHPRR
ncbi:MAG: hypothetical protein KDD47_27615, partial [Acidobacteria bacterium]|nr:hypothetical protein [Acidobacteriota bacterium]